MVLGNVDIGRYPKFAYYVKNDIPKIIEVKAIIKAMQDIGQINRATLKRAVKWNVGPTIKVTILAGAYGEFTPGIGSNEIRIEKTIIEDFEAGRGKKAARAGNVYLVGVTLLHELVHWGDDQDGIDRPGEEGEEFESRVYGNVIF